MATCPACDKHPNLQMIRCSLTRTAGSTRGYICPVPVCGRHLDENGYFDLQVNPGVKDRKPSPQAEHLSNTARLQL